jgi:lipoprotein-anchoring transpeptidase ErfK/SrfK
MKSTCNQKQPAQMQIKSRKKVIAAVLVPALAVLGGGAATKVGARESAPAAASMSLRADVSQRMLYVYRGGQLVKSYEVAVGKASDPTPRGSFAIRRIVWNPAWVPPDDKWARGKTAKEPGHPQNPMKVVKLFFQEPDYYIHGTDKVGSLGEAASHGCLRMATGQVTELAAMVQEAGGSRRDWSWIKRTLHLGDTRTVSLSRAVPLTIVN